MSARPSWTVYLLRCADRSLYCGITNSLEARVAAHNAGRGAKYTRSRLPVVVAFSRGRQSGTDARRLEYALKQLSRAAKQRLVDGDVGPWRALRAALVTNPQRRRNVSE
ncbi:MAG: GIY-YIG nuclease family protein [Deltaproteobacteria bacterium]